MKQCSTCKQDKPESEYHFVHKKTGKLRAYCKKCGVIMNNVRRAESKDRKRRRARIMCREAVLTIIGEFSPMATGDDKLQLYANVRAVFEQHLGKTL